MKPRRPVFAQALRAALALIGAAAFVAVTSAANAYQIESPAKHIILMDYDSGQVLIDKDGDTPMPPASMSKLMTVEMVFHALKTHRLKLDDTFHVSKGAWAMKKAGTEAGQGSLMFVMVNDDIKISDLLRGIIVQSGNDACVVVAEGLAGTEDAFARQMNARAKELGLTNSHFASSYGWPDAQEYMSARDLAVLARHIIKEYPEYYPIFAERDFTWSKIHQPNRNPLLGTSINADGLKTGHTDASGYGMVASAAQDGRRLILVVNGLDSESARRNESLRLMQIGFREFDTYKLLQANQVVAAAQVYGGTKPEVALVVATPVTRILNREARADMKVSVDFNAPLKAPVKAGAEVGKLTIDLPGSKPTVVPVYAADAVNRMGAMTALGTGLQHLLFGMMGDTDVPHTSKPKQAGG
jgi:serine-type D-Ala-D-Ala carboxypeptidase (penicillin-binding protein 5/6)